YLQREAPELYDGPGHCPGQFSSTVCEDDDWWEHCEAIIALARRRAPQFRNARERGLEIEFDVAIHEDDCKANVVYSLLIDQEFIKVLAEVEANLAISLYKPS
ncbi:MAG: hypothetical protein IIC01_08135, partial [Planctomycetes bacterium]|nr:hypothetical protein [Planctomycetota bacterium]